MTRSTPGETLPGSAEPHWPGVSALVVPVPALEPWVRHRTAYYDQAYVSDDPTFAHAHVTLLSPFVAHAELTPQVCDEVARVLDGHGPFSVRFERVHVFPDGLVHLVPEPDEPFRRLTAALGKAFPGYPPYGGRFGDVRPHLTLDRAGSADDVAAFVASVAASVAAYLPAVAEVSEARLSWYEQDACRTLARWPLG